MELIRINDRKLKIMLTPSDMSHFEMNAERLGEDTEQMRRSFRMLMKEVRRKIAFELDDRRISVQYFPSREGGCEMFISCSLQEDSKKRALATLPESKLPVKSPPCWRESIYQMEELNDVLRACQRLQAVHFEGKSQVYRNENQKYLLVLNLLTDSPVTLPPEFAFLAEYGEICNTIQTDLYIQEHATLISDRAVEELAHLA